MPVQKMRDLLRSVPQITVMAAIVTTLMFGSVGALVALLCIGVLGISFHALVTFGDSLNAFAGLLAWWAIGFAPALAYAVFASPGVPAR